MPPKPRNPMRRFDVFAEYRKLEQQDQGTPEDEAKGCGLWIAKVVAARRFGRGVEGQTSDGRIGDAEGVLALVWLLTAT